jgi:hypothetical protein
MSFLRFLMLLSLILWIGGIVFFATLAPTLFTVLPTRHLAGSVVSPMLTKLHWIGLISGVVYLASSMLYSRLTTGDAHPFVARHVLIALMLLLTVVSQFGITPKMAVLRASLGEIDAVPPTDPGRIRFNALHVWSTRLEIGVLLMGLAATYLTARRFH